MFYEERFREWSKINYNDLILDDYILFGHGSYRSKRFRDSECIDKRIDAVEHYAVKFCKHFKIRREKFAFAYNDEIGSSKVRELAAGHNHLVISAYQPVELNAQEAAQWSNKFWKDNYGICQFEPFNKHKKKNAIGYLCKATQNNLLVMNDIRTSKAMKRRINYLKNN